METTNLVETFVLESTPDSETVLPEGATIIQFQDDEDPTGAQVVASDQVVLDTSQLEGAYIINHGSGELQILNLNQVDVSMIDGEEFEIVTVDEQLNQTVLNVSETCATRQVAPFHAPIYKTPRFKKTPALLRTARRIPPPPTPPQVLAAPLSKSSKRRKTRPNPEQIVLVEGHSVEAADLTSSSFYFYPEIEQIPGPLENEVVCHVDNDNLEFKGIKLSQERRSQKRKQSVKPAERSKKPRTGELKCLEDGCTVQSVNLAEVKKHLTNVHNMTFDSEEKSFPSDQEFKEWRLEYERERMVSFIYRGGTKKVKPKMSVTYMVCHRSGHYKPTVSEAGRRQRKMKPQGSCKIGGYCTAGIKICTNLDTGEITAFICHTHYGHPLDSDAIPHLRVNPVLRKKIVRKFEEGMNLTEMMAYIHLNPDGLEGLRVVDRRAIRNIYEAWKKSSKDDVPPEPVQEEGHSTAPDEVLETTEPSQELPLEIRSVKSLRPVKACKSRIEISPELDATIDKLNNHGESGPSILLYKRVSENNLRYGGFSRAFKEDDFCLIIQTPVQRQIFQLFHKVVSIDVLESKEDDKSNLKLTFLSVLDDYREAIPVAWMVSDSTCPRYFNQLFRVLRYHCGQLPVSYIMAPRQCDVFKSWTTHFSHQPKILRNSCGVKRDLRTLLNRFFPNDDLRKSAWQCLESLANEREIAKLKGYQSALSKHSKKSQAGSVFMKKFEKDWLSKIDQWSLAYRTSAPVNLEGISETFSKLRKFVCFKGTKNLNSQVDQILKIGYDKCFFRTKRMYKGDQKLAILQESLSACHKLAQDSLETCTVHQVNSSTWTVGEFQVFHINSPCSCKIKCKLCSSCSHEYTCTCSTFQLKKLMCQHIHKAHCTRSGIPLNPPLASSPPPPSPETITIINETDLEELNISQVLGLLGNQQQTSPSKVLSVTEPASPINIFQLSRE